MTLMAIAQRPDIFKLAIAGAPVVIWEAYDTGYTERYMDTPANNKEGYKNGSVLDYISGIPDTEGRLLLIHGLKDENVHFVHTAKLIETLVERSKPYELFVYPKERHGLRSLPNYMHAEVKILSFIEKL